MPELRPLRADEWDSFCERAVAFYRRHGIVVERVLSDNGACAEWDPWGFDGGSGANKLRPHKNGDADQR